MPGYLTTHLNNAILAHVFGATPFPSRRPLYLSLSTMPAMKSGDFMEPPGMERVLLYTQDSVDFTEPSDGGIFNRFPIFIVVPNSFWGTIYSAFVIDALSPDAGGKVLAMTDLATPLHFKPCTEKSPREPLMIPPGGLLFRHS